MKKIISNSLMIVLSVALLSFTKPTANKYQIDNTKSKIVWTATKVTGSHTGNIQLLNGTFSFDGNSITEGSFDLDMNSITCTDLTDKTYNEKLIGHIKSDDFFSVEKFKKSTFAVTKSKKLDGERFEITGNLTIKGITKEISFPATIKTVGETLITVATITVDRTKYDIKYGSGSFFENLGDKAINDNFELKLTVVSKK